MTHSLCSPAVACARIAELFSNSDGHVLTLGIREDKVFAPGRNLRLGNVTLSPPPDMDPGPASVAAVMHGFYEVEFLDLQTLRDGLAQVITGFARDKRDKQVQRAIKGLDLLPAALTRVGLLHPTFDPDALELFPFSKPATIIMDTSAIIGGGLDFAARFLHPAARVKVPGIVHMELVNDVDNYLSLRREEPMKAGGEAFASHCKGIAGQGVLLRLELLGDVEVERSSIFQEPLRHAFSKDRDTDSSLATAAPVRSYCDRLILEAARLHQAQVSPGHPLYLMTADQGLARMALAEGFAPILCEPIAAGTLLPVALPGTMFDPFSGAMYGVPLTSLLWELTTAYGSVTLEGSGGNAIEISTLGADLPWQTFHARQDLRWVREGTTLEAVIGPTPPPEAPAPAQAGRPRGGVAAVARVDRGGVAVGNSVAPRSARSSIPNFGFSAGALVGAIGTLAEHGRVDRRRLSQELNLKADRIDGYVGFLRAGGLVEVEGQELVATDALAGLFNAMRTRDFRRCAEILLNVQSFAAFVDELDARGMVPDSELRSTLFWRLPNYRRFGEACGRMLMIKGEGLWATPKDPSPEEFVTVAMSTFHDLGRGEYVLSGQWLEEMAKRGIHPLVARDKLQLAQSAGLMDRFTRGATPDTRFEGHEFHVFEPSNAGVALSSVQLYHGQFLIPERSSVEIRLKEVGQ